MDHSNVWNVLRYFLFFFSFSSFCRPKNGIHEILCTSTIHKSKCEVGSSYSTSTWYMSSKIPVVSQVIGVRSTETTQLFSTNEIDGADAVGLSIQLNCLHITRSIASFSCPNASLEIESWCNAANPTRSSLSSRNYSLSNYNLVSTRQYQQRAEPK